MNIVAVNAAFVMLALASFRLAGSRAIWLVFFLGLAWLPPVVDPLAWPDHPWLVIGGALPSENPVGKAQIVPMACLLGNLLFQKGSRALRLSPADGAIAAFCLWPIPQAAVLGGEITPSAGYSAVFLCATWGALWLLGRLYLRNLKDLEQFAISFSWVTVSLIPLILVEQITQLRLHDVVFGPHPFMHTGQSRWIGSRPLLFFEDGNQYGLWIACAALSASWLWKLRPGQGRAGLAIVLFFCAIASQSAGAIILLLAGSTLLFFASARRAALFASPVVIISALAFGLLHMAGIIESREIILNNPAGKALYEGLRELGKGSLGWRVGQDLKTFPTIRDSLFLGTGQWDWFRPTATRPWGLPQLIIGQFGFAALGAVGVAAMFTAKAASRCSKNRRSHLVLPCLLVAIAAVDSVLNSFVFYPAITLAGGCTRVAWRKREEEANDRWISPLPPS